MSNFINKIGGRKFFILLLSMAVFIASTAYLLVADQADKAGVIVAIATGLTMISGAYFAGNVAQKQKLQGE